VLFSAGGGSLLRARGESALLRTCQRRLRVPLVEDATWSELRGRLHSFIARRVSDSSIHDDLAQEILLRLHRGLPSLRDTERLDAFAYQIARNAIADHHRRGQREQPVAPDSLDERASLSPPADQDEAGAGRAQLARCLRPLIERLDDPYREAMLLTDLGDLSQAEAARQLGLSEPGMRSRVQRARSQLRDALAECCTVELDAAHQIGQVERRGRCTCNE
jgi:RNA polymerase sigma-70 factor (ECF subfamily)